MAKQLTAPGCKYSIVARVDTTIYSPDQKWVLDVPAGQTDFIAETNEIIIPADAMMCRKKCQISADLTRFNVLGRGAGSLATFVTRAIEQIVGKGNAKVEYGDGKLAVSLADSVTAAQIAAVENLLDRLLPKDVVEEIDPLPSGYMQAEFLESTSWTSYINPQYTLGPTTGFKAVWSYPQGGTGRAIVAMAKKRTNTLSCNSLDPGDTYYNWRGHEFYGPLAQQDVIYTHELNFFNSNKSLLFFEDNNTTKDLSSYKWSDDCAAAVKIWRLDGLEGIAQRSRVYLVCISEGDVLVRDMVPALDKVGMPCLFDRISRKSFYNSGTGQFIVGLTMTQALDLANLPVPTTSNTLTISLPKEASLVQHNQEVETALSTAAEKGWNIAVQYRDAFEDEAILNKYAECVTLEDVKAVNPDYLKDLTSDREWIYPLDSLTASRGFSNAMNTWNVNKIKTRFLQLQILASWTFSYATATSIEVYCPEVTQVQQFAGDNGKLRYLKIYAPKTKIISMVIWGNGLVDLDFEAPNLENCSTFGGYGGYITHTSAIKFMNSLPAWTSGTHNLKAFTVHIDGKTDPEFQKALTSLENRGWDVDVQWYGTPTAQASTFDMGTLIYAKIGEIELPDGTTEHILDWGHYVTNWEERGYEQFRSLESAYAYFGLEQEVEK